jgi:peroxiredoxin Q/BCP
MVRHAILAVTLIARLQSLQRRDARTGGLVRHPLPGVPRLQTFLSMLSAAATLTAKLLPESEAATHKNPLIRQYPTRCLGYNLDVAKASKGRHMTAELEPGAPAPDFILPRDGGGTVGLADFRGKNLVLYFYPRAATAGCTREAIAFTRLAKAFARAGTAILGVSGDPVKRQDAFKAKYRLSIPLASDETHRVLKAYGVWVEKTLYGRKHLGIARTTYLIDARGRIARVWRKVKVDGHAEDVLAAAKAL